MNLNYVNDNMYENHEYMNDISKLMLSVCQTTPIPYNTLSYLASITNILLNYLFCYKETPHAEEWHV